MPTKQPIPIPSPRALNLLIVLGCLFAMGMAYYLDGVLGLEPCPLCMTQRGFLLASGMMTLAALAHNPGLLGQRLYGGLAAALAVGGAAVAGRHVWLQHLPEDQVPACGPSLEYMLETLPFSETLRLVLMGDGNCAEVVWTFLGLSIPEQALIFFTGLVAMNLFQVFRK
jgi:protein dithiol:quinone oxidoreductase